MHPGWSADFRYTYFRQLLRTVRSRFRAHVLSNAPEVLPNNGPPILFLRHDVKISLARALRMAEIEHEYGLPASYMVRADSLLYSLDERQARVQLLDIVQMGHEVGLHFDLARETCKSPSYLRLLETEICAACDRVEQITCRPIRSISFQRPLPLLFGGPLLLSGRVNADAGELRQWCLSDAGGNCHYGDPVKLIAGHGGPVVQMVLHPIWWGERHALAPQRLQEFFDFATRDKSAREASAFDLNLAKTVPTIRRQTLHALMNGKRGGKK
ncbi:MAG TPA: hypothetical protein VF458_05260 [Ktedonobacteraceae bacterium]